MSDNAKDFIKHHGVKGMKWGVRKDRGRRITGKLVKSKVTKTPNTVTKSENHNKPQSSVTPQTNSSPSRSIKNIDVKNMSDAELNALLTRLQKEKQLGEFIKSQDSWMQTQIKKAGTEAVDAARKKAVQMLIEAAFKKVIKK